MSKKMFNRVTDMRRSKETRDRNTQSRERSRRQERERVEEWREDMRSWVEGGCRGSQPSKPQCRWSSSQK